MAVLFLLMTIVPAVELYLLIQLGGSIGAVPTLALVILTGIVGASLAKQEGLRVLARWRESLQMGQMPADGVLSGVLVLLGGTLLILPGVLTDVVGLVLLIPATRAKVAAVIRRSLDRRFQTEVVTGSGHSRASRDFTPRTRFSRQNETDAELVE